MKHKIISLFALFSILTSFAAKYDGTLITDTLSNSKIYPGTMRQYQIYVPKQYDASKPACLYVGLDGILYNAPAVMDSLIASGDVPVTIGVFVRPGIVYDKEGNVVRYNRSNEFDRTDGTFASFLETEILPLVEGRKLPDGKTIKLSSDPNDRAISGASSSGICSFVAAWFRPDMFNRVYTTCGTYVAMRGGNELPALVRKTVPQPIRFYIHDGSQDAWNPLFGHWYEQNLLVASALEFAGYDLTTKWDDGNHSIKNGSILFPEAFKAIWAGYPERIKPGKTQNNMLSKLLIGGETWQQSNEAMPDKADNMAIYPDGKHLAISQQNSDWMLNYTINSDGTIANGEQFYWLHNPLHQYNDVIGMEFDTEGNLYVATAIGIQVCDHNGRVRAIIPYPGGVKADEFAFTGNTLYINAKGKNYTFKVNATAHLDSDSRIQVKSQGEG